MPIVLAWSMGLDVMGEFVDSVLESVSLLGKYVSEANGCPPC